MNSNEKFIIKTTMVLCQDLNLSSEQKEILKNSLYQCSKNYHIEEIFLNKNTTEEIIELYLQSRKLEGLSDNSIKNMRYTLKCMDSYINKDYKDITILDLRSYLVFKQKSLKSTTINCIIAHIKVFFKWLITEEYIDRDPSLKLKRVKIPNRLVCSIDTIDLEKIRLACSTDRDRAIVEFAFTTGMRVSEISKCNKSDIDFNNNSIRTIGKGDKERVVLFSDKAKFYLLKYLKSRNDSNEALFVSSKKPFNRLGVRSIQKMFSKLKEISKIDKKLTPHVMRHTMATKMISGGADLTTVQTLLGHEQLQTTLVYAETSKERVSFQYKQCLNV